MAKIFCGWCNENKEGAYLDTQDDAKLCEKCYEKITPAQFAEFLDASKDELINMSGSTWHDTREE